jgi:hypothetical protein
VAKLSTCLEYFVSDPLHATPQSRTVRDDRSCVYQTDRWRLRDFTRCVGGMRLAPPPVVQDDNAVGAGMAGDQFKRFRLPDNIEFELARSLPG